MVTLGNGATAAVQQQISSLGANILQIRPGQGFGRGGGGPQAPDFDMADVEAIQEQIAGVRAVAPQAQASGLAVRNAANWQTTINGTTCAILHRPAMGADRRPHLHRRPRSRPARRSASSAAPSSRTCSAREDPVGERFRIRDVSCEVIGTLATRGQGGFGSDQDDVVIMPIKAVQRRFTGNRDIRIIMVAVDDSL